MNGVILSLLLSASIAGTYPIPITAELAGGYHVGPLYGLVSVATNAEPTGLTLSYNPLNVCYDFRLGVRFSGFDVYLSRFCIHNVEGALPEAWGWRAVLKYDSWQGE